MHEAGLSEITINCCTMTAWSGELFPSWSCKIQNIRASQSADRSIIELTACSSGWTFLKLNRISSERFRAAIESKDEEGNVSDRESTLILVTSQNDRWPLRPDSLDETLRGSMWYVQWLVRPFVSDAP